MTGLFNYEEMMNDLEAKVNQSQKTDHEFTLGLIDIDNFDKINNNYGHKKGDEIIIAISDYLKESMRDYEKVYRQGGDEFGFILDENNKENIKGFVDRIYQCIMNIESYKALEVDKGLSIGVTNFDGSIEGEPEELAGRLYKIADEAMYLSKRNNEVANVAMFDNDFKEKRFINIFG